MRKQYVATIGFFDGVHRGHQFLLGQVMEDARRRGMRSMAVTFAEHPCAVLAPDRCPPLLTTPAAKRALIERMGIDRCEMLHFTPDMARLTSSQFLRLLAEEYDVRVLLTGYDHHFGADVKSTSADYRRFGAEVDIDVVQAPPLVLGQAVSSSAIRAALAEGRMEDAVRWLGRPYTLSGDVVKGCRIGRTIGFPTANVVVERPDILIPAHGVYAAWAVMQNGERRMAMVNIGCRPTFGAELPETIEAHLLHFDGDIYCERLTLHFVARLRDERHFEDAERLRRQLTDDARHTAECLKPVQNDTL